MKVESVCRTQNFHSSCHPDKWFACRTRGNVETCIVLFLV